MTQTDQVDSREIDDDLEFQRRSWKVQRVGWAAMLLLISAGLLGLFGQGPLSRATSGTKRSPLYLEYERFTRLSSLHTLSVEVLKPAASAESTTVIWVDREWLAGNVIERITPEPNSSVTAGDKTIYAFGAVPGGGASLVIFTLTSRKAGRRHGRVGLSTGQTVSFSRFTYP